MKFTLATILALMISHVGFSAQKVHPYGWQDPSFQLVTSISSATGCTGISFWLPKKSTAIEIENSKKIIDFIYGGPNTFESSTYGVDMGDQSIHPVSVDEINRALKDAAFKKWASELIPHLDTLASLRKKIESDSEKKRLKQLTDKDLASDALVRSYFKSQHKTFIEFTKKVHIEQSDSGNDCD
jgi:hypothetical protein